MLYPNSNSTLTSLNALLAEVVPGNVWQAGRLGGVRAVGSVEEFCERVPLTTKQELAADQVAHPPYGSNLTFPVERYTRFCRTSGTSSQPMTWLDTAESWGWMLENWARIYAASGVGAGARVYFAFSFGPFLGFWTAFEAAARVGCLCIPGGGLSSVQRLRAMVEQRAEVLLTTPTYALHLAEVAAREGIRLDAGRVRTIIVAGEPGGSVPEVRARISAGWNGARVVDHYGMTEVGPVAFEEEPGVLRILADSYFAEVIVPETGRPAADGEVGELVLTPLGRAASPVLRYRTGDLVRATWDERGWRLDGGILGRADDMVVVRGVNLYPSAVDAVVRTLPEVTEYRVRVLKLAALTEVRVAIESPDATSAGRLERALTDAFSLRIPVELAPENSLPRSEHKARRWVVALE